MSNESEYFREAEATRVRVLSEALPYIQQFANRTVVVKYGGAAMKDSTLKDKVVRDIVTPGILRDYKDPTTLVAKLDIQEARQLINDGVVGGGMIPKVQCCVRSLAQGVRAAHIIDGRIPHALLLEILTNKGIGSMLVASEFLA